MMRNLNEDLEDFLKRNADNLQMRPSYRSWNRISSRLRQRRKIAAWFTGVFILMISLIGYYLSDEAKHFTNPKDAQLADKKDQQAPSQKINTGTDNTREDDAVVAQKQLPSMVDNDQVATLQSELNIPAQSNQLENRKTSAPLTIAYVNRENEQALIAKSTENNLSVTPDETVVEKEFTATIIDDSPEMLIDQQPVAPLQAVEQTDPLTIESVSNSFIPVVKTNKLSVQFFVTPSVSYRKLSENESYTRMVQAANGFNQFQDINNAVTHKPALGMEVGISARYALSKNIGLIAGLQFNMSQYSIKAYENYTEAATITLRSAGSANVTSTTNLRNFNGHKVDWIHNQYFQASLPLGVEVRMRGNGRTQFGIASTVQPSYLMGDRAYLLSTDYKNYTEVPWLMRRWNLNTNLETFVSYSTGKIRWQVGPQVRYQMLSSFKYTYPVKENLFDFGLKVAVSLNKR